ncbi:MAG TPA: GldG family protein, partial [Paludibacteraceae bacterium]|nr:GldG family protein [Paludibacteraceae bacterium]
MSYKNQKNKKEISILIFLFILVFILILIFPFRLDLSSDKRYTISPVSKKLMQQLDAPLKVTLYLEGDLNPGFLRMKKSTIQMLEELSAYSKKGIEIKTINPSLAKSSTEREKNYLKLSSHGLTPTAVYERDKEGKAIQKIIFPWLEIEYKGNKTLVNLLKNLPGNSGEQNINISIENLEFEITDAIRRLTSTQVNKIAFLEGHGELSEAETYDISKALSRYFQIDRGIIGTDASILDDYKVLIVAKPMFPFSEKDKFIIDQYIMKGGRILWLI